jgi:hypothetical protein
MTRADSPAPDPRWIGGGDPDAPFPLTDLQAAYLLARYTPELDPVGCHTYLEFAVPDLNVGRLEAAWTTLARLHPMLRATVYRDGTQSIALEPPAAGFYRYETVSQVALPRHLESVRAELSHRVYAPDEWPLYDIRVTPVAGGPSRVHVSMDSWIVDGTSAELLHRQWRTLYEAPETQLQAPRATFREFVMTMRAAADRPEGRRSEVYWREKLRDLPAPPPVVLLPQGDAEPGSRRRHRVERVLPPETWASFRQAVRSEGLSAGAALLGAFAEQLRPTSGPDRLALVATVQNRPPLHPDLAAVVGPCASTIVMVVENAPGEPLRDRVRAVSNQLWRDLDHPHVSGVAALRAVARRDGAAAVPVVFSGPAALADDGPSWLDEVDCAVAQTPGAALDVQTAVRRDGLHIACNGCDELLEPGVAEALVVRFAHVVTAIAEAGLTDAPSRALLGRRRELVASVDTGAPDLVPLTPLQRAYLAQARAEREEPPPVVWREFELPALDATVFQSVVDRMLDGSPELRSVPRPDRGCFVECSCAHYPAIVEDLRGIGGAEADARMERAHCELEDELRDAGRWPRFALRAFRCDGETVRLQVLLDMVAFDGDGTWRFCDELLRGCVREPEVAA